MDNRIVLPHDAWLVRATQAGLVGGPSLLRTQHGVHDAVSAIAFALEGNLRDYDTDTDTLTLDVNVAPAA